MTNKVRRIGVVFWPAIVVALSLIFFNQASAQISTATIRGTVSDEKGPLPGAQVAAVDKQTGFNYSAYTDEAGRFNLPGLRAGTYEITISLEGYVPQSHTASVLVGRTVTVDFQLASDRLVVEDVTVVGETLIETKNTDVATNITSQQIETLPQNERNFLNFAALAPGIRVRNDETRKQITSGGLEANSTNVFIDGVSYKNDTLEGGVIGQDSSRGNPFPQNAVQEFKVVTQNFKAEYETSASSIVTAVTKSGGNLWRGDAFLFYQADALVQQDDLSEERGDEKPELTRYQAGISLGGPIVKDKFHMFASFEENYQDRASTVFLGATPPPPWQFLDQFEGTFTSPFRSHLFFAKASYQPNAQQTLDFSFNSRNESDERGFGSQTSFESAEEVAV
ncbi:carboxypeptidase-like regulatory domain-containing protein, partial [bacterium]|nr:carboxypeptidase-like regulatory domain-containing protein [bacterium]